TRSNQLDPAENQQDDNDAKDQSQSSGRRITPVSTMRPAGQCPKKSQNQDHNQYRAQHVCSLLTDSEILVTCVNLVLYREAASQLQGEAQSEVHARIHRVAQVIHAVDLDDVNVLGVKPVAGPRLTESEPISPVLKAVIAVLGLADAKRVLASETGLVSVCRNPLVADLLRLRLRFSLLRFMFLRRFLLLRCFVFRLGALLRRPLLFLFTRLFGLHLLLILLGRFRFLLLLLVVLLLLRVGESRKSEGERESCCANHCK